MPARRLALSLSAAALLISTPAFAQLAPRALPVREGEVTFHVRATIVKDFTGTAPVARAEYAGGDLAAARGVVEVRVADMRTGIGLRDRHLRAAMDADSFPVIRFELTGVVPGVARGDTVAAEFVGRLTIHGVTRGVQAPGKLAAAADSLAVIAAFPLDMRDYGITPPVRMLGALRVAPDVAVGVRLVFGGARAGPQDTAR